VIALAESARGICEIARRSWLSTWRLFIPALAKVIFYAISTKQRDEIAENAGRRVNGDVLIVADLNASS
jgi:hypothetical protein